MNNKYNIDLNKVSAEYLTVFDVKNNEIIVTRDGDYQCYPASITKLLNAIVAVKHCQLDEKFVVGDELDVMRRCPGPSTAGLIEGQTWTFGELLYASLLPSGNDAAHTIAYNVVNKMPEYKNLSTVEKVDKFVEMMNEEAKNIGCTDTEFATCDGHDHVNKKVVHHVTTTNDLVKVMIEALKHPEIVEVIKTEKKTLNIDDRIYTWQNTNRLIHKDDELYMPYVIGGKTGTTNLASYCLLTAASYNDNVYVVALTYAATGRKRYEDAKYIFECICK